MPAVLIIGAFLAGSLPFSFWLGMRMSRRDLRQVGSGNPGATNLVRVAGWRAGALGLGLDIAKGALPVLIARSIDAGDAVTALTALAATFGHMYSPFLGLRGGKGVATGGGALAVLSPLPTLAGCVVFVALIAWKRYVSLASMAAAVTIGVLAGVGAGVGLGDRAGALASAMIALLVVVRHKTNVERLAGGREPRFGEKVVSS